jgi:hypothetical protein
MLPKAMREELTASQRNIEHLQKELDKVKMQQGSLFVAINIEPAI